MPEMEAVSSSRIVEYGYEPESATVYVTFTDGIRWRYANVPEHIWEEFRAAGSKGRFIADVLNHYEHGPA